VEGFRRRDKTETTWLREVRHIGINPLSRLEYKQMWLIAAMIREAIEMADRGREYFEINEFDRGRALSYRLNLCEEESLTLDVLVTAFTL
jgi:hypothetical protein